MSDTAGARFDRLVWIMHTLRGPNGCPWDREQTLASLRPFVLEETCELLDTLDADDMPAMREELGDVLFETVFLAELTAEAGHFDIGDSITAVTDKLIRRHPHVFTADGALLSEGAPITSGGVKAQWDDIKDVERSQAGKPRKTTLGGIPRSLPALLRAEQLGRKAAGVGFDWVQASDVLDKVNEEVQELREAIANDGLNSATAEEELGDLLFAVANFARKMGLSPETALRKANDKFQARFEHMEHSLEASGQRPEDLSFDDWDRAWTSAKHALVTERASEDQ